MVDVKNLSSEKNTFKTYLEFEIQVKDKLNWSRSVWEQSGEKGARVHKLVNSMNYWVKKLKPAMEDNSMVFTIFNEERDGRYDIDQIITAIESVDKNIQVKGFSSFRNPRYLCMYFENQKERDYIVENFKMVESGFVTYLHWACDVRSSQDILKVHWLPMSFSLDLIKNELNKYVNFIDQEREALKIMSGRDVPSGKVTFKVVLKEGVAVESIPHTAIIGNMEALITVPGRKPLCLNCSKLGHISKDCKLRYCQICVQLLPKHHECNTANSKVSYAGIVKKKGYESDHIQEEDWEAAFDVRKKQSATEAGTELANNITQLENQLHVLKSESNYILEKDENFKKEEKDYGRIVYGGNENENLKPIGIEGNFDSDGDYEDEEAYMNDDHEGDPMVIDPSQLSFVSQDEVSKKKKEEEIQKGRPNY